MNFLLLRSCLYNVHIILLILKKNTLYSKNQSDIIFCCEVNKLQYCKIICVQCFAITMNI